MAVLLLLLEVDGAEAPTQPLVLSGDTFLHDPSSIVEQQGRYYVFSTGRGVASKWSPDLVDWTNGPAVFERLPSWTTNAVPGNWGFAWAPDVSACGGQYYLYYSVSTFGRQTSAIGLATSPGLNGPSDSWRWTDRGPVIQSTNGSPYNAIDPSVLLDKDGRLWMAFGSFWGGLFLTELDPRTGLRTDTNASPIRLAWAEAIEAACLAQRGEDCYLFMNWGRCCRGTNSTYEVRVGRSQRITGPYVDRDGNKLVDGGGTLFLGSSGRFVGPGHIGLLSVGGTNWFSYHYYDGQSRGRSRLALGQLGWTDDGWPIAKP